MAVYVYRCQQCGAEAEQELPIGTAQRMRQCVCGGIERLVLGQGVYLAADALPNKKHGVRAVNETEARWERDMPAYHALRKQGLQPKSIDGAHEIATVAESKMEVERGEKIPRETRKKMEELHASIEPHPAVAP